LIECRVATQPSYGYDEPPGAHLESHRDGRSQTPRGDIAQQGVKIGAVAPHGSG
jgi:hypothetical protein